MPGHTRPNDGVASLAYVPGIHVLAIINKVVDGRDKFTAGPAKGRTRLPGHDNLLIIADGSRANSSHASIVAFGLPRTFFAGTLAVTGVLGKHSVAHVNLAVLVLRRQHMVTVAGHNQNDIDATRAAFLRIK